MPRSSRTGELIFNLEIEKVERKLRKEAKQRKAAQVAKLAESLNHLKISSSSDSESDQETVMAEDTRTLRELAAPNLAQQPLCINFPTLKNTVAFELKSGLIHLLPSFHGLAGEEPQKHLQEFDVVCSSMKPPGVTDEQIKLRAFPFSLKDAVKDWLYYLPSGSIDTWNDMKKKFLEKYFPASRAAILRKEICGIKQKLGETLHEYLELFNKLIIKCPQHQIPPQLLIQYFYDGLSLMDRNIIDAASGGALVNKTPAQAWDLIARMAENTQQFGSRDVGQMNGNNSDHAIQSMQQQLSELTSFVCKMDTLQMHVRPSKKNCAVDVNIANYGMNRPPAYNPYSNTYNPGWRDHPNLRYGNAQQGNAHQPFGAMHQMQQPRFYEKQLPQAPTSNSSPSLEDLVKSMATSTLQFQQEMKSTVGKLQGQINQVSEEVKQLRERGKWPAQPESNPANVKAITICSDTMIECSSRPNPKNTSAITLRSGKELEGPPPISKEQNEDQIKMEIQKEAELHEKVPPNSVFPTETKSAPFPNRLKKPQKANKRKEMMEIFKKVELNIPLLEAINQIPKYAKFLKELCTNKRKLRGDEHIIAGENVSAILKRKVPPITGDPGPLKETGIFIQLADRTNAYPDGRPFMCTAGTKIDVKKGTLSLEFDGEELHFNIFNPIKCPVESESLYAINVINYVVQETYEVGFTGTVLASTSSSIKATQSAGITKRKCRQPSSR
ncbi:uncharacterized protein LOC127257623 [Andrographis paniculata]|uniref:uncharacterized protein LOC127257623 n=1 Tax=Andrographis paniculata TaxID=175694 RepID=UPI0021E8C821|nr:uncharacterized protein LOC127257623 [Andrographis paniculata]